MSDMEVQNWKLPGRWPMGGGLYLQVSPTLTKSWFFRYSISGRTVTKDGKKTSREMGLGPYPVITLAMARDMAIDRRRQVLSGIDPIEAKRDKALQDERAVSHSRTFDDCVPDFIQGMKAQWSHPKSAKQWENTLRTYGSPVIGKMPVAKVDETHIQKILDPIWYAKPPTAKKVQQRLARLFSWAIGKGYRPKGFNPADWRNNLQNVYPGKRPKSTPFPSLPYQDLPAFFSELQQMPGAAANALQVIILSAMRSGAVLSAKWDEVDFAARKWTIPHERMKARDDESREEHDVPLSSVLFQLLSRMKKESTSQYLFPSTFKSKDGSERPLGEAACKALLQRMERTDFVPHGFRATFKTWATEETHYPWDLVETAMGHVVGDPAQRVYLRAQMFRKRTPLMEEYAQYAISKRKRAKILQMKRRKKEAAA